MLKRLLLGLILLLPYCTVSADWVTELGAGWKIPASSSLVVREECHVARVFDRDGRDIGLSRCGGNDPVFVGWPIAWERETEGRTTRVGWLHVSHWFDGGTSSEFHFDAIAVSVKFNWSKGRNGRSKRR